MEPPAQVGNLRSGPVSGPPHLRRGAKRMPGRAYGKTLHPWIRPLSPCRCPPRETGVPQGRSRQAQPRRSRNFQGARRNRLRPLSRPRVLAMGDRPSQEPYDDLEAPATVRKVLPSLWSGPYSCFSALMGATRLARMAGTSTARAAMHTSRTVAPAKEKGSVGDTL